MNKMILKMENTAINRYGFEHPITLAVFKTTDFLRDFFKKG